MNILIPHTWLLEHLETDATPLEIQQFLSLCGPSVERIYEKEGEAVYDIEVTTNRVDSMSIRGIAREAAVILRQFGKKGKLKPLPTYPELFTITEKNSQKCLPFPQVINKEKLCKRTLAVILRDVSRAETPAWMAKRLRQIDVNVHDAVIDITNYITHELGHPCHAFDYDALMALGGTILITQAEAGKKFRTLDDVEYTTTGGEVVFENAAGEIIDLPGIKGTANTSIHANTKNILFWLEDIEAKKIRSTSMTHAIRTVAAQLNEKNVDPELAMPVLEMGTQLFQTLCNAKVASQVFDDFPGRKKPSTVQVPLTRITDYLGVELPLNRIAEILEVLECTVELKKQQLVITPTSFRPDIEIPADVIEEIARMYGYHNLPSVLMPTALPLIKPTTTNFELENRIKHFLATIGWQEVYTYSMVSERVAEESGHTLADHLKIQNALTDDRVFLRRSLIPSLEEILAENPQQKSLRVFEIAHTYEPQPNNLPLENLQLAMVSSDTYREVRGQLEVLLQQFFITEVRVEEEKPAHNFRQIGKVSVRNATKKTWTDLGKIGILASGHVAISLQISQLLSVAKTHPKYQSLPKTSEIIEDLTFTFPDKTPLGDVLTVTKKVSPLLQRVEIRTLYGNNATMALTYNNPERNMAVDEVAPLRKHIVEVLRKEFGAILVGNLA